MYSKEIVYAVARAGKSETQRAGRTELPVCLSLSSLEAEFLLPGKTYLSSERLSTDGMRPTHIM